MSTTAIKHGQHRMVQAHYAEATVEGNGVLRLGELPFPKGTVVEVIILEGPTAAPERAKMNCGHPSSKMMLRSIRRLRPKIGKRQDDRARYTHLAMVG